MAQTWNDRATGELVALARAASGQRDKLVVMHTAGRTEAEVLRAVREGHAVVVFVGIHQEPVDALLQLRPFLDDDELSIVAHALGF